MSSIDERVVEAKFDNRQFQEGVKGTLSSLDSLKKGLNLDGATKGLDGVASATSRITNRFSVMRIAAVTAIATVTKQLVYMAEHAVAAFTIDPIKAGFENYETQINAIQTILANTGLKGKQGLEQVNGVLAELNTYANKTVYNFSEMARNIGTFTAAGVKLKPAAESIKGIANLAAMSGSNSQQASTAMYQLSQAIAAGRVKLQDWNSVVNAGLGGKVFQKALFQTGQTLHTIKNAKLGETFDQWTKAGNTFRGSLQDGWVTSKVLTNTLAGFTGDLTKAQLKSMGYNQAQIKQIQEQGKTAVDAATKIKTLTQLSQALKEEVATAYSAVFKTIFGDINQAKKTFSALHTTIENALTGPIYAFNKVLSLWAKLGGRDTLIEGLKAAFQDLAAVIKPIKDAFKEIFPAKDAFDLLQMTTNFRDFMYSLKIGAGTADKLKRIFAGLFAILDIGWQFIKAGIHFLGQMIGTIGHTSHGVLDFAASLGDMLVALDNAIKTGHGFTKFFDALHRAIAPVMAMLGMTRIRILDLAIGLAAFFKGITQTAPKILSAISGAIHTFIQKMGNAFHFEKILQIINAGLFTGVLLLIRKFVKHLQEKSKQPSPIQRFIDKITEPFHELTDTLKEMQKALQAATILEIAIAVGILTASVVALSMIDTVKLAKALGAITVMFAQLIGALFLFNKVGGAKGLFTTSAGLILFAAAVRVLTSSVVALSKISWEGLAKGLVGVTALLAALVATTKGMQTKAPGLIRTSAGLLILAAAIKVLASAVTDLSKLSWGEIARGLTGVAALLVGLTLFTKFSAANKGGLAQGAGLLLLGAAIKVLASAMQDFGKMSWGNIAKGLVTVGAILAAFAIFSRTVGKPIRLMMASAALLAVSVAMNALAAAMKIFASISWGDTAKSLIAMAVALDIITASMGAMPLTSALSAVALIGISAALVTLAGALKIMASMSWGDMAKSLITLAASLTIIAVAMAGMVEALPGAAALLVVAAALAILVPELALLGQMSWLEIAKALGALAGAFIVFGVAADALSESIPAMYGLAGSVALLGVGLAAVGGGVYLFALGLQILAIAGAGAATSIKLIVESVVGVLPTVVKSLGATLVALAETIAAAAPALLKTAIIMFDALLTAINVEGPKVIRTFYHLLENLLGQAVQHLPSISRKFITLMLGIMDAIDNHSGRIIRKFTNMVVGILNEMAKGAPRVVTAAVNWLVAIINGIDANLHRVIDAGTAVVIHFIQGIGAAGVQIANASMDTIVKFINGLAAAIRSHQTELGQAGQNLAFAIADGMTMGMASKVTDVARSAVDLAKSALGSAAHFLGIKSPSKEFMKLGHWVAVGFAKGIIGGRDVVIAAWQNLHDRLKTVVDDSKQTIADLTQKLKDLKQEPKKNAAAIAKLTAKLAEANIEFNHASAALDLMNHHMQRQHDHLIKLGKRYDEYTAKIEKATQKLANAKQVRDDYRKSIKDQYDTLPDIAADTSLAEYEKNLKKQIVDTQSFADVMAKLRKMGLDDKTYKELIDKGPEMLPFAEQILAGGPSAIKDLDKLDAKLKSEAAALGASASTALYQAGVDSAQGLLDGLKKKRKEIADEMRHIAHALVVELKNELKIKSPSQVFDELGQMTGKGLSGGLVKSIPHVKRATQSLGKNTVESMKQAIREMNDLLAVEGNMNPAIKPVLDLSAVRRQAVGMGQILGNRLAVDGAYAKAMNASSGYEANLVDTAGNDIPQSAPGGVTFIQNNNSPKALSTAEIYRNTNNQLSRVKGALNPDAA